MNLNYLVSVTFQPINPLPPATSSTDLIQRKDEDISAKKVCHESRWTNYRVTHQVVQNLPLTSKHKFRFGLAWLGQSGTFVFKSMGGFAQPDVSPCTSGEIWSRTPLVSFTNCQQEAKCYDVFGVRNIFPTKNWFIYAGVYDLFVQILPLLKGPFQFLPSMLK